VYRDACTACAAFCHHLLATRNLDLVLILLGCKKRICRHAIGVGLFFVNHISRLEVLATVWFGFIHVLIPLDKNGNCSTSLCYPVL
jgi:hypothetical protein